MRRALASLTLLVAVGLAAVPGALRAQPVSGFYVGGGLGAAFAGERGARFREQPSAGTVAPVPADPPGAGASGQGSFGYGLGNGLRFEMEGSRLSLPKGP